MLLAVEKCEDGAVVHGLAGRPSNRRWTPRYSRGFWPESCNVMGTSDRTLAAVHLAKEGLAVSRETLDKIMQDSSLFCWLEECGPACQLIAVIDDATSPCGPAWSSTTSPKK